MYGSHSIPVSVKFQHSHTSFCLMKYWLGVHLNQILFNEEKYKKHCHGHHYPLPKDQLDDKNSASSTSKAIGIK